MGHRKYAELQEAAKQCEKTNSVRRSGRSTTRSRAVTDAIDDELQSRKRAVADAIDDWLPDSDCDSDSDMDSNSDVGICYATERRAALAARVLEERQAAGRPRGRVRKGPRVHLSSKKKASTIKTLCPASIIVLRHCEDVRWTLGRALGTT